LMIDLTRMQAVRVDHERRLAWVQGGALLGNLDRASQHFGLATTAGNVSHTGVGGLTLGGGMGWLARQYGLSCDNVTAFELITADGSVARASASENADLFWGLRGGGGNFGVVTEFEFRLHPVGREALIVEFFYALDDGPTVLGAWRDLIGDVPREATMTAWVGTDPDGRPVVCAGYVWVGDPAAGERLIPAMRALGPALASRIEPITYLELQTRDDDREHGEHAFRRYWKGHYLREFTDAAIEAFLSRGALRGQDSRDGTLPAASLQSYGGAIREVRVDDSAFDHRDVLVEFVASARWTDPTEDGARIAAARRYGAAMEPFSSGAYVNTLTDEGQAGVRRAYRADKLARLTALKDRYDPDNVFHLNHNIRPRGQIS
jgi:hypothetical protein